MPGGLPDILSEKRIVVRSRRNTCASRLDKRVRNPPLQIAVRISEHREAVGLSGCRAQVAKITSELDLVGSGGGRKCIRQVELALNIGERIARLDRPVARTNKKELIAGAVRGRVHGRCRRRHGPMESIHL